MQILICIDDTDNIDSRGTGELAEMIAKAIEECGWGKCSGVTRHQLLLDPAIPYTSHNSSMCFVADIEEIFRQQIIDYAAEFLTRESQAEADPGLCVAVIDELLDSQSLIDFGYKAKREVVTKEDAYSLARRLNIHLSEHGGNGQGIIGALAGAGLRLSYNDGRFKGTLKIDAPDNMITVQDFCSHPAVDEVRSLEGAYLDASELVLLGNIVKPILVEGKAVILVQQVAAADGRALWKTCSKKQLSDYEEMRALVVNK
jgi:hypothetical protein